jgi:hypothetical protein
MTVGTTTGITTKIGSHCFVAIISSHADTLPPMKKKTDMDRPIRHSLVMTVSEEYIKLLFQTHSYSNLDSKHAS